MNRLNDLPFVTVNTRGQRNYWNPEAESGNWLSDGETGRKYADSFISQCPADLMPVVLPWISDAISKSRNFGAMEIGFYTRLGEYTARARRLDDNLPFVFQEAA